MAVHSLQQHAQCVHLFVVLYEWSHRFICFRPPTRFYSCHRRCVSSLEDLLANLTLCKCLVFFVLFQCSSHIRVPAAMQLPGININIHHFFDHSITNLSSALVILGWAGQGVKMPRFHFGGSFCEGGGIQGGPLPQAMHQSGMTTGKQAFMASQSSPVDSCRYLQGL